MLPRHNRLRKTNDFKNVFEQGSFVNDKCISLKVAKNDLAVSRFGFIVSNKVSKKAVLRNKVKRRLRAAVSEYLAQVKPGYDVVVLTRPDVVNSDFGEIRDIIIKLLKRANLLN